MALTDPQDTLAFHNSRVLTTHRDMSEVPCANIAKKVSEFLATDVYKQTVPESEALWFYGMNHGMALISATKAPLQPLDAWEAMFVNDYHMRLSKKAIRAFYYLLLICTREARHNQSIKSSMPKMMELFGPAAASFFNLKGGEGTIHKAFLDNPPAATLGNYVRCLQWQFYNSAWNGGYGGKAWGAVTDCLVRFVTGEFTAEMMLDTVWTLSHNNGPIFNKMGLGYAMYSDKLLRILDIQRSGQIPEAVLYDKATLQFAEAELVSRMQKVSARFPEIGKYVDWEVVENLGSVHHYPHEKAEQFKIHGMSPAAKEAAAKAAELAKIKKEQEALAKAEFDKKYFVVMQDLVVEKIQINRAA